MTTHPVPVDQKTEPLLEQDSVNRKAAENTAYLASAENLAVSRDFLRLVVVIPGQVTDQVQFSRAIRNLALPGQKTVVLVMLVDQVETELAGQRQLATLSSLVNDARIKVQTTIVWEKSWQKFLGKLVLPGDLVVCPAETAIQQGFNKSELLFQALNRSLQVPVYILQGFFPENAPKRRVAWKRLPFWVMIIAIFAGFFEFEAVSDLVDKGWPGQVLTIILLLIEFGFIYLWASLAG